MQKKLFRRITASLILSVMLFALPVGAFIANTSNAVTAYAEDDVLSDASDVSAQSIMHRCENCGNNFFDIIIPLIDLNIK